MIEKFIITNQLVLLLALLFVFLGSPQEKRFNALETRQTNHLVYLESRINALDSKLDAAASELEQSLKMQELRRSR